MQKKKIKSIKSFLNKSLRNDGLLKGLYYAFWDKIKQPFMNSMSESKQMKHLSTLQNQPIIKLLKKLNEGKRFICNERPISLLNFDLKIISKALALRLKNVLSSLIDLSFVNRRFINESGSLISDIIEICDKESISGYLTTIDFEKAFDSLNIVFCQCFL